MHKKKHYKLSKKKIIALIVIGIVGCLIFAILWKVGNPPSTEMTKLRQIEKQLNLPVPTYRYEDDDGQSQDGKGILHYDRSISLNYSDSETTREVVTKINAGTEWKQASKKLTEIGEYYDFTNETQQACIIVFISAESIREHYAYIADSLDDRCSSD